MEKTKEINMDIFAKEIKVTFPEALEKTINSSIHELNVILCKNIDDLCRGSISHAVKFTEYTGEALYVMLDPEEYEESCEDFMKKWNGGDVEILANRLKRWNSKDDSEKIALECKDVSKGGKITIHELFKSAGEAIIKLGLSEGNFGNVYPAIKDRLEKEPKGILQFMRPCEIDVDIDNNSELTFTIYFHCDWEVEHGIEWTIDKDSCVAGEDQKYWE